MNERKVTIGFKGSPHLKLELRNEAEESEMTVSEYLEAIVENRQMQDDVKMLRFRLKQLQADKESALSKIEDYEERLSALFQKHKGQSLQFRNKDGSMTMKFIGEPIDILDCILTSMTQK